MHDLDIDLDLATPGDGERLSGGERLLIRTLRRLALGATCHGLQAHFELACGPAGEEAYRALKVFVAQLRVVGRRRIDLAPPPAGGLTRDERCMLQAFAAAQADDYATLDAQLCHLAAAAAPPASLPMSLGAAVCLVAQAFAMQGLLLTTAGEHDADQDRGPVRCGRGHHMAVPDRPREFQALVHIEDHAR